MKVLFVCLGNICRSPAAEAVMLAFVKEAGLSDQILCDSAGTSGYHEGEPADSRMIRHGKQRGYNLLSISRPFRAEADFEAFDLIVAMDDTNFQNIIKHSPDKKASLKVRKMVDYQVERSDNKVPDPYYGGEDGFEEVFDILEDACHGLLKEVQNNL